MRAVSEDRHTADALLLMDAVACSIKATGDMGAPEGVVCAGFLSMGASIAQYEAIIVAMVGGGMITRQNRLLVLTNEGETFLNRMAGVR